MKELMTRDAASRIQSAACRGGNGTTPSGSFAARAMSSAYRNEPLPSTRGASSSPGDLSEEDSGSAAAMVVLGVFAVGAAIGTGCYYAYKALTKEEPSKATGNASLKLVPRK